MNLLWLTWRQHRMALIAGGLLVVLSQLKGWMLTGELVLAGFVAVFWGAPLVAREFEQRTHVFAWSQDVSPGRWLFLRTAPLLVVAAVLAGVLGIVGSARSEARGPSMPLFELWPPLQVAYVLFGLALGVMFSALTRRTVPSMGLTLAVFALVRTGVALLVRPHSIPFVDYRLAASALAFHVIESAIFVVLAAGLFVLAWRLVRRQETL